MRGLRFNFIAMMRKFLYYHLPKDIVKEVEELFLEANSLDKVNKKKCAAWLFSKIKSFLKSKDKYGNIIEEKRLEFYDAGVSKFIDPPNKSRIFHGLYPRERNRTNNGCILYDADLIVMYLNQSVEVGLKTRMQLEEPEDVRQFLDNEYKYALLNTWEDTYYLNEPESLDELPAEAADELSKELDATELAASGIASMFKQFINSGLDISEKSDLSDVITLSDLHIDSLSKVERIIYEGDINYIFLEDIYIIRTIEGKIRKWINEQKEEGDFCLIKGEAGNGKSTLLWHIHYHFTIEKPEYEINPIFIKSSDLEAAEIGNLKNKLIELCKEYMKKDDKPLILLDTMDLVLRGKDKGVEYSLFIQKLLNYNATVIATSRLEESAFLSNNLNPRIFKLDNYDTKELKKAIEKHTEEYALKFSNIDVENETERILSLIDKGLPIKALCENPLTLRMLFSIYFPNRIPDDIDKEKLYTQFWQRKILLDFRPGENDIEELDVFPSNIEKTDLSFTAALVASFMLIEGKIEVEQKTLLSFIDYHKDKKSNLDSLKRRGIIKESRDRVYFFHQTFFEYTAGRAILASENGFDKMCLKIGQEQGNLFLLPIFENLLILGQTDFRFKESVLKQTTFLLSHNNMPEIYSGIYVFTLLNKSTEAINDCFIELIKGKEFALKRYVKLLPNTKKTNFSNVRQNLRVIWQEVNPSTVISSYIDLMHRFVRIHPNLIKKFIAEINFIGFLTKNAVEKDQLLLFIEILEELQKTDHIWAWRNMFLILETSFSEKRPKDNVHKITYKSISEYLLKNGNNFSLVETKSPTKFISDNVSKYYANLDNYVSLNILKEFSELWRIAWSRGRDEIIFAQCSTNLTFDNDFERDTKLTALGRFVSENLNTDILPFIEELKKQDSKFGYSVSRNFMLPILSRPLKSGENTPKSTRQIIDFLRDSIKQYLTKSRNNEVISSYLSALNSRERYIPTNIIKSIFDLDELSEATVWLSDAVMADLFPVAFVAKQSGAVKAAEVILSSPSTYEDFSSKLKGKIMYLINRNEYNLNQELKIEQRLLANTPASYSRFVIKILETEKNQNREQFVEEFQSCIQQLITSKSHKERARGWDLIYSSMNIATGISLKQMEIYFNEESQAICKEKILSAIYLFGVTSDWHKAHDLIGSIIRRFNDDDCPDSYVQNYLKLLASKDENIQKYADEIIRFASIIPKSETYQKKRFSFFATVLNFYIGKDRERFLTVFKHYLKTMTEVVKGSNARTKLANSLEPLIKTFIKEADKFECLELLGSLDSAIPQVGVKIINSLFHFDKIDADQKDVLDNILIEEKYSILLKERIRDHVKVTAADAQYKWEEIMGEVESINKNTLR